MQPLFSSYPLNIEVSCTGRVTRWRPLFNWVLVIPLYLWLTALIWGAGAVTVLGWFAIVFGGRLPENLGNYLVAVLRYEWRVYAYLIGLTERYPGFRLAAGYVDPGDSPTVLYSARPVVRRRLTVAFRFRSDHSPGGDLVVGQPGGARRNHHGLVCRTRYWQVAARVADVRDRLDALDDASKRILVFVGDQYPPFGFAP